METARSYVKFTDGHEEDILHYEVSKYKKRITFSTKSGVYDYMESNRVLDEVEGLKVMTPCYSMFRKLVYNDISDEYTTVEVMDIEYICIDTRVPYNVDISYCGDRKETHRILASPNATREEIINEVIKCLKIDYRKVNVR